MIPVLYTAGKSAEEITPMGALTDAISCDTKEERNGVYETTLVYPSSGELAEEIQPERIVYVKTNDTDDAQPMRIVTVTKEQDNTMTIYAQHVSYQLNGVVVLPFTVSGIQDALSQLSAYAPEFTFSSNNDSTAPFTVSTPTSLRSLLGGTEGSLLDVYGGEYHFDGWTITFDRARGADRGALIAYGKNLTDLSAENDLSDAVTGVLPYYQDQEGNLTTLDAPITMEHSLSYERITPLDCSSEIEVEEGASQGAIREALTAYGEAWLKNQTAAAVNSVTLSFESLYQAGEDATKALESIALCDPVTIWDKRYNLKLTAKCITAEYDGLGERYTSLEIGQTKSSFSSTLQSTVQVVSDAINTIQKEYPSRWEQAIAEIAGKITGQTNSHIMLYPMENPEMIIAAEDTDLSKPGVRALVINAAGIVTTTDIAAALSAWDRGENLFTGAMSIDGELVERVVQAIEIEGKQIKAGIIQNTAGTVKIDLDSGDAYVPRLLGRVGDSDTWVGIEQGQLDLSGAQYNGVRYYTQSSANGAQTDYLYVLRNNTGVYLIPASTYDGPRCVLDLAAPSSHQSSQRIFSVRRSLDLGQMFYVTSDGNAAIAGEFFVMGHGGQLVDTSGALTIKKDAQILFQDSSGKTYFAINPNNVAGVHTDYNIETAQAVIAGTVQADSLHLKGDTRAALRRVNVTSGASDYALTFPSGAAFYLGSMEDTSGTVSWVYQVDTTGQMVMGSNLNMNGYAVLNQSDKRLKKYITGSKEKALPILEAIPMRQYTYKAGAPGALPGKKVRFGQVAQELYEVYPEAVVHDEKTDSWYINKIELVDLLLKGVQELSAKVTSLETEVKTWKENANGSNH